MRILALDIATKCGFAISGSTSGTWDLTTKRDESKGVRLIKLRNLIQQTHENKPLDLVVFEAVRAFRHQQAVVCQSELQGVVKAWCHDNNIEYKGYTSSEIKKHATGKGNAKKDQMIKAAAEMFEIKIFDDNHADALWILDLAKKQLEGERFA